jgi:hypothetical protein
MTFNASITLKMYDSYFDNIHRAGIIKNWLTKNNIEYDEMKLPHELLPHTYLMDSKDALAFKLKFGL